MKTKFKPYTKEETKQIVELFNNNPTLEQKIELANKLERDVPRIYQKFMYEREKIRARNKIPYIKRNTKSNKPTITVTHLNQDVYTFPTIQVGDAVIKMTSRTFKVAGIQIEC